MFEITEKKNLGAMNFVMGIKAPRVAKKALPGQFIILRVTEEGERIPLTIVDNQDDIIKIVFQTVGYTTKLLASLNVGDHVQDFVGPLGEPSELDIDEKYLIVGGGVGIAPIYPQIKYLYERGNKPDVILGAKTSDLIIYKDEIKEMANNLYIATDDGSEGIKGFVTQIVQELLEAKADYNHIIAIGPLIMMKMVCKITKEFDIKTIVSMNPIMVDGTGMCGCCRVTYKNETKYACVDGPEFDGRYIDFDEAMMRQTMYKEEEHDCRLDKKLENFNG